MGCVTEFLEFFHFCWRQGSGAGVLATWVGCGGGAVQVVKLSDVDTALSQYEGNERLDPFSGGEEGAALAEEWVVSYGAVCPVAAEGEELLPCPPKRRSTRTFSRTQR